MAPPGAHRDGDAATPLAKPVPQCTVEQLRVLGAAGTVEVLLLELQRLRGHRWRRVLRRRTRVSTNGRFLRTLRVLRTGRWRVRARYLGTAKYSPSLSRFRYFRVRPPR